MVTITNRKFRSLFGNETTFLLAAKDEPIEYQFDINVNYAFESTWLNSITVTAANQLLLNGATWESRGILEGDEIEITYPDPPPPHSILQFSRIQTGLCLSCLISAFQRLLNRNST
jgi:hypothetical protein